MEVGTAATAASFGTPGGSNRQLVAAACAPDHLSEARHIERLGRQGRLAAGRIFFFLGRLLIAPRLTRLVTVSPLPILPVVRHGFSYQFPVSSFQLARRAASLETRRIIDQCKDVRTGNGPALARVLRPEVSI